MDMSTSQICNVGLSSSPKARQRANVGNSEPIKNDKEWKMQRSL